LIDLYLLDCAKKRKKLTMKRSSINSNSARCSWAT